MRSRNSSRRVFFILASYGHRDKLDEPTAALDPETENALVRALHTAAEDRIVVIIAHRLSTIRQASHIVFIDDGQIADQGTHEFLMRNPDSPYRHYVELQA